MWRTTLKARCASMRGPRAVRVSVKFSSAQHDTFFGQHDRSDPGSSHGRCVDGRCECEAGFVGDGCETREGAAPKASLDQALGEPDRQRPPLRQMLHGILGRIGPLQPTGLTRQLA